MRITVKRSLGIAALMLLFLLVCSVALAFLEIDRKVFINGSFTYRDITPVVIEQEAFVKDIIINENNEVVKGDTILVLQNRDIEIDLKSSENRLKILKIELEEILNMKEYDMNLNTLDITKLKEQLLYKQEEEKYYTEIYNDKKNLYEKKIASKDQYDEAELNLKNIRSEVRALELKIDEINKKLRKLDTSTLLTYKLKQEDFKIEKEKYEYLKGKIKNLTITAGEAGKLLADRMDMLKNTYMSKGNHIADIVSFDDINFIGYAADADVIRIKEGQEVYFNVELFKGKDLIKGIVKKIGYKPINVNGIAQYPIEIEIENKKFFNRDREYYLQAGVTGEAIILTEKSIPLISLFWERFVDEVYNL